MNAFFVELEVKKGWKNIRDPYRKRVLDVLTKGDQPARGRGGGKRKILFQRHNNCRSSCQVGILPAHVYLQAIHL